MGGEFAELHGQQWKGQRSWERSSRASVCLSQASAREIHGVSKTLRLREVPTGLPEPSRLVWVGEEEGEATGILKKENNTASSSLRD